MTWRSIARCGTRILLAGHLSVPRQSGRITSPTGSQRARPKRISLQSYSIEQLAIHVTDDIATNYYRINVTWANSAGAEVRTDRMRITHTWIRTHGTWQIIGGMSSPVNASDQ